ncbi:MAG: 4-hydroxybenzoate polyprenyltransferase [Synechococcus sp.]|nr:4-hydroxybenzoate polyprenyltransferase [Synechococcus sp.]
MQRHPSPALATWLQLLRWNKPSGRLILLIPAGWCLWLTPGAPPSPWLVGLIVLGGLSVSGAGCVANDLWDRRLDSQVERTKQRPLARGELSLTKAGMALIVLLLISLLVVLALPTPGKSLCLILATLALPPILVYPSAKRWFPFPQAVLALCWGFAVLIPWAAAEGLIPPAPELWLCWLATLTWTFGFDTVYAMADRPDDRRLGLRSSALTLGGAAVPAVTCCYAITLVALAGAALYAGLGPAFWPCWMLATIGMLREPHKLQRLSQQPMSIYGRHFKHQVWLGSLLLFGLVLGRLTP